METTYRKAEAKMADNIRWDLEEMGCKMFELEGFSSRKGYVANYCH